MKSFCASFNHWLYHPVDTRILCGKRALRFAECRRCQEIESQKGKSALQQKKDHPDQNLIPLDRGSDSRM